MKTYQSTKIVEAAPITGIPAKNEPGSHLTHLYIKTGDGPDDFQEIPVPSDIATRYWPELGDYLVKYADGYLSISPKKAFEEGYAEIPVGTLGGTSLALKIAKAIHAHNSNQRVDVYVWELLPDDVKAEALAEAEEIVKAFPNLTNRHAV